MIARKNLLLMETCGYCSEEAMGEMEEELTHAGFEDLDFSGTTTEMAGYGQEIRLNISGSISYSILRGDGGSLRRKVFRAPFSVHLSSTAKH